MSIDQAEDEQPKPEYAPPNTPCVYVDTVTSFAFTDQVAKFYLGRSNPSTTGTGPYSREVVAQVVMPLPAFAQMTFFFTGILEKIERDGAISTENLAEMAELFGVNPLHKNDEQGG